MALLALSRQNQALKFGRNGQEIEKCQTFKICSMTSSNAVSAIGTQIRSLSGEIQALKVGRKFSEHHKIAIFFIFQVMYEVSEGNGIHCCHSNNMCSWYYCGIIVEPVSIFHSD